jgi:anti-sigma regulatory factor (Ser/Thr protein kinase)
MRYSRTFAGTPRSVKAARSFTSDTLVDTPREALDAVVLMVSELASNCVRFAASDFTVNIERLDQDIRVEVADAGAGAPTPRAPQPEDLSGRGLMIVQAMSEEWGVALATPSPGKTVWFTVRPVLTG